MTNPLILWVDDEIDLLKPYIIYLQQKGYTVTTCNNGSDAIDLCQQQHFDLVFLDENMPGLSGIEIITDIRAAQPALPIVMVTKSEEENLMEEAIGQQIADYLVKPVNPSQILMTLKKHIHQREIVEEKTNTGYQQEFQDIAYLINTARTLEEWMAVHRLLTKWELELQSVNSPMCEMLRQQRQEANAAYAKFVMRNYTLTDFHTSRYIFRERIFPLLDAGRKTCLVVIDNFRYDQWKAIQPMLSEMFHTIDESLTCTILPTATQYARNAIFSGLMPLDIQKMYPQYWVEEDDDEGKNLHEQDLIREHIARYRRHDTFAYYKINETSFGEKVIRELKHGKQVDLTVIVLNFIDMLSHSRTESKMMRELCADEAAYRSLTQSWFRHSSTYELFRTLATLGYTVVLTTDHGTIRVQNPVAIIGDKGTNTNLRYKVGKALSCKSKDVYQMERPSEYGLPSPNVSSSYMFCTGTDFFGYPNNFNYYAQYYRNTFQHGGISMEEMLVPLAVLA